MRDLAFRAVRRVAIMGQMAQAAIACVLALSSQILPAPAGALETAATKAPVRSMLDLPYAETGHPRQRLDLYLPYQPISDRLPVVVYLHGGGWTQGSKGDGTGRLKPLVRSGRFAGVSVGYRLSGEAIWPAQIHDTKAAIRWIKAHADEYGLDPTRIAVWGRSAGAYLALMLGVTGDAPELEGDLGEHLDQSSEVAAVVNYFGPTDFLAMIGQPSKIDRRWPKVPEARLIGGPLLDNQERARAASPMSYVSVKDPPILTVHGTEDMVVPYDQAIRLNDRLTALGVPSYFISVLRGGHGEFSNDAEDVAMQFLKKLLLDEDIALASGVMHGASR